MLIRNVKTAQAGWFNFEPARFFLLEPSSFLSKMRY